MLRLAAPVRSYRLRMAGISRRRGCLRRRSCLHPTAAVNRSISTPLTSPLVPFGICAELVSSAQAPAVSPDGKMLVFVGYTTEGYDLFSMPLASAAWSTASAPSSAPSPKAAPLTEPIATPDHAYRPWRTLVPQFWMPILESDAGEVSAGAANQASDALGRHTYGATVAWTSSRARPDWSVAYAYDRWWPTLFASVSDDIDPWRGGEIETREVNAGALFTVTRVRWSQSFLAAIDVSRDTFACGPCAMPPQPDVTRGAIRSGWVLENAKAYGYSISRESGAALRLTARLAPEALGSDAPNSAMTVDARAYHPLGPRHAVVAARAAGAVSWGDKDARRVFSASGSGPASGPFDFGRSAVGLLRGFESDSVVGGRVAVGNLDYRFPLLRVQRGAGTIPVFIRTIHAAIFADAANAWDEEFRRADVRVATGAELSFDTVVGFGLPLTFTTGAAWRRDPSGRQDGAAVFGRIGRAF